MLIVAGLMFTETGRPALAQSSHPTDNDSGWRTLPGTGDIDSTGVYESCPCPFGDQEVLGVGLFTPIEIRVIVDPQDLRILDLERNCTSLQQSWVANTEYTTQHRGGGHASAGGTLNTEVSTGKLLSTVLAEGKVGVEVTGEVGGSYEYTATKVHGRARTFNIPACAGLFYAAFYVDYYAEGRRYIVDHLCCRTIEFIDVDGTIVETCDECYRIVSRLSAFGDGDGFHVGHLQEFHPCDVGCVTTNKNPVSYTDAIAVLSAEVMQWTEENPSLLGWQPLETRDASDSPAGGGR
ncbi:MAG: hypothetical protein Tsb0013_07910 [Phycisphaerales bacterium]